MLSKKYFNQCGLKKIIKNKIEESKQLDYKDARALTKDERNVKELSKDISAFANSEGGVIIYGITEDKHLPKSLSFIDGNEFSKEWLENVIDSNISPKIQDIVIHPIRLDNSIEQTIYVVEIPESPYSPHMANDNKYYRRYNFKSVPMEEYDVRNLYFKTTQIKLIIEDIIIISGGPSTVGGKLTRISFSIDFLVCNVSKVIEKLYKLEIQVPDKFVEHGYGAFIKNELDRRENGICIYAIANTSPLFQNEKATVYTLNIEINENNYLNLDELILKLKLYYSGGIDTKEVNLGSMLKYSGQTLTPSQFLNYKG